MQHHEADTAGSVGTAHPDRADRPAHPDDAFEATAGQVLAGYLNARCADFLRSLRLYGESGSDTAAAAEAASALRCSARRIGGTLHTFRVLLDPVWADQLRTELGWLSGTLAQEYACTARLHRLVSALGRLSGSGPVPGSGSGPVPTARNGEGSSAATAAAGALTVGASRAGALLERQLTLARTRSHSAALQALGSSRFHAVADAVAVLASEVPLAPVAGAPAAEILAAPRTAAERRLLDAASALPLARAAHPYNAEALVHGLATPPTARPRTPRGTRCGCCSDCTGTPRRSATAAAPRTRCWPRRAAPWTATATRRGRRRPRRTRPAHHGSPRRRRTRSACCTRTSASKWRRRATSFSGSGNGRR